MVNSTRFNPMGCCNLEFSGMDLEALQSYSDNFAILVKRDWKPYLTGNKYLLKDSNLSHVLWMLNNKYGVLVEDSVNKKQQSSIVSDDTNKLFSVQTSPAWGNDGYTSRSSEETEITGGSLSGGDKTEETGGTKATEGRNSGSESLGGSKSGGSSKGSTPKKKRGRPRKTKIKENTTEEES